MSEFTVTKEHIKLLQNMYIEFCDEAYIGAPAVDIKRPYGNSSVFYDIGEIIGISPGEDGFTEEQEKTMLGLHRETATALQILARNGSISAGIYRASDYGRKWERVFRSE